jgi:hypothetical protein
MAGAGKYKCETLDHFYVNALKVEGVSRQCFRYREFDPGKYVANGSDTGIK